MEYKDETTSISGSWNLGQWHWKHETAVLMQHFLASLKDKKVLGLKCPECGLVYCPPKPYCSCLSIPEEWVEISDEGVVTTFTFSGSWSYGGMEEGAGTPRIIVGVMLDGSNTEMLSQLEDADRDHVDVGMRVKVKWADEPHGTIEDVMHSLPA